MTTAVDLSQTQTSRAIPSRAILADVQLADRAIGLAIAAVVPALFWVIAAAVVGHALGTVPSPTTLAIAGTSIAAFLTIVAGSIMMR